MAYADSVIGPWTLYEPGVMHLQQSTFAQTIGEKTDLNTLRKYVSDSEAYALMHVGQAAQEAYAIKQELGTAARSPLTPHIASPEVVIGKKHKEIRLYTWSRRWDFAII